MSDLIAELRMVELLSGVGDELLERISTLVMTETFDQGETLVVEAEVGADLYFVRSGTFVATVSEGQETREVGRLGRGEVIGESQLIAGGRRTATVRAMEKSEVLLLPAAGLDALMAESEPLREALSNVIHSRLRDAALRVALARALGSDPELLDLLSDRSSWVQLQRGEILWEQGTPADDWYVLVSGELSIIINKHGVRREVGCVRRGEVFGEIALLRAEPRTATILAARECWLARFDHCLLAEEVLTRNSALQALLHTVTNRLSTQIWSAANSAPVIAILPRDPGIDTDGFLSGLTQSMGSRGRVVTPQMLRAEGVVGNAESLPVEHPGWLRFEAWVESHRRGTGNLLLVTDGRDNAWTRAAVAQADRVLLLVDSDSSHQLNDMERAILDHSQGQAVAPVWLVIEHPADRDIPTGTALWLDPRELEHHAHIRRGHQRDIARLARWLVGEMLGVALSGGGARGFVHLGAAEAIFDAGYELDLIVGTSAGAMVGSLLARDEAPRELTERSEVAIAAQGNPFAEFDLPLISLLRSRRLRDGLHQIFEEMAIEDSWIPLRVVATNLTESRRIVFQRGPVWQRVFASSSPPGLMPPVQYDNVLLCDGGLVDNLPVSVLVEAGCKLKLASYVGSSYSLVSPKGGLPTSWALLIDRILRRRRYEDVPTLMATLLQCISVPSAVQLEAARSATDIFLQPDLSAFSVTDFNSAQAMFETGETHARAVMADWQD